MVSLSQDEGLDTSSSDALWQVSMDVPAQEEKQRSCPSSAHKWDTERKEVCSLHSGCKFQ